ncbi:MAG: NEW3 domain-containing protein [Candidatus Zixiibacteriota bacterium]
MSSIVSGQAYNPFNQRDDRYRLLGLKRAKEAHDAARAEFNRQQELFNRDLISNQELERARSFYSDAEVNYHQSLLAVLFEEQYVTVSKAIKYQNANDEKRARLTLTNPSGGSAEFQKLLEIEDELFRSLQPDVINNVYVSLLNDENAIISQPYEIKIPVLRYGEPVEIDFELLQDLDAVKVFIIYSNGSQREMKIFLQKDVTVNRVAVQSEQFSQEVELGSSAAFDLNLELYSSSENTFSLEVVNLPRQIGRVFKDRSGQARLSQVKFTQSSRSKQASLEITLPDRPTDEVKMDEPISFFVLVLPRDKMSEIPDLSTRQWTLEAINNLDIGFVRLELVPRGKGRLLVRAPQLYHAIMPDESVDMYIDVINEGSRHLDNIRIETDMPLNWTKNIQPPLIESLEIDEERRIRLIFTPSPDASSGKYEVRVKTSGMSDNQPVTSDDKTVSVEIKSETNIIGIAILMILVVGLVGGIVFYGVRLSRK